jgi:hypothetical protein
MRIAVGTATLLSVVSGVCVNAQPSIKFSADSAVVSGMTAGEGAYQLVVTREARGYRRVISAKADHVEDATKSGVVTMREGRRVPMNSVWIAVDPATGASATATPREEVPAVEKARLNPGQLRKVTRTGQLVAYLWVRPKVGAWTLKAEDSGRYDDDPAPNGKLAIDVERMTPVGDSPSPPSQLAPGDVLFAVDVLDLTVVELR